MTTILLLVVSNIFMTIAWYGHLKIKKMPLAGAIALSWGLAFFEYLFQVPANRWGYGRFTLTQLKILQECITLIVFTLFALAVFKEVPRWNTWVSYAFLVGAVGFAFWR